MLSNLLIILNLRVRRVLQNHVLISCSVYLYWHCIFFDYKQHYSDIYRYQQVDKGQEPQFGPKPPNLTEGDEGTAFFFLPLTLESRPAPLCELQPGPRTHRSPTKTHQVRVLFPVNVKTHTHSPATVSSSSVKFSRPLQCSTPSSILSQGCTLVPPQEVSFHLQSSNQLQPEDPAGGLPSQPPSPFPAPSLLEMKPTGKHAARCGPHQGKQPFIFLYPLPLKLTAQG